MTAPNSESERSVQSANRQIARAAGTVMLAFVASNLIGLLAKILTANAFGTGAESEAFYAANRFTEILFNLVAGGALASAFIPTFTGLLTKEKKAEAWRLASGVTNLVTLVLTGVCALSYIFAPEIVRYILAPGFGAADPAKEALTIELLRIQLPSAIIFGVSGLVMGMLNTHRHFLIPALAPAMYQLGWIFGLLVLKPIMGVYGLGWGVVLGSLLHLAIQLPTLFRVPGRIYIPSLGLGMASVREVIRLMGPRLLGVAVVQLNFLLNTYLASSQPEGSVSAISLAFSLMLMPQAAIAQSIAIAALPTFSAQAARGKLDEMRASLTASLRGVLLLAIPATIGLILLRHPLVALLYERGEFTAHSTDLVSWALLWYGLGLVAHSVLEIVNRAFYAMHDTKTPVMVGIAAMTLNLVFSLVFSALFLSWGWAPHGGLALANTIATFLEVGTLLFIMRRRLNGLQGYSLGQLVAQAGIGSAVMGLAVWAWMAVSAQMGVLWITLGGLVIGGGVYLLMTVLLRVNEINRVWSLLLARLKRA